MLGGGGILGIACDAQKGLGDKLALDKLDLPAQSPSTNRMTSISNCPSPAEVTDKDTKK